MGLCVIHYFFPLLVLHLISFLNERKGRGERREALGPSEILFLAKSVASFIKVQWCETFFFF